MATYQLLIQYDGTNYGGWQTQSDQPSIQSFVEEALQQIFSEKVIVRSSGRTDAGVHAIGQSAHIILDEEKLRKKKVLGKLHMALNALLPEDIRVIACRRVSDHFHARFSATGKEYRYRIDNNRVYNPLWTKLAWHIPVKLDVEAMQTAAHAFTGKHDFKAIAVNPRREVHSTVRTIHYLKIIEEDGFIHMHVAANGFLYKMVRSIVGVLVKTGHGRLQAQKISRLLTSGDHSLRARVAPAHGLILWEVFYPEKILDPNYQQPHKTQHA